MTGDQFLLCRLKCLGDVGSIFSYYSVSTVYGGDLLPPAQQSVTFSPRREPGLDLGMVLRSEAKRLTRAIDVFIMFFTAEAINRMCANTDKYAWTQNSA